MNAHIICGGKGTRVSQLTDRYSCRKHELPIRGRKFIDYVVDHLLDSDIIDNVNYVLKEDVGTGGAMRCIDEDEYPYLMLYGDMLIDVDIKDIYNEMSGVDLMILSMETSDRDYGHLMINDRRVVGYSRKHDMSNRYMTNVGMYLVNIGFDTYVRGLTIDSPMSLEHDIFECEDPNIFEIFNIIHYPIDPKLVYDIGTPERYYDACNRM